MASTASKFGSALMSAIALAVLAAVPSGISIYIFALIAQSSMVSMSMVFLAVALGVVGLGLTIACVYTFWWAFTKSSKKEDSDDEDQSWKDMPYPKG